MHSLDDAEVASQSFLRWTSLDGHDSPPWEIGCARWTWQDEPEIRRGVLVFDLPVSSVGTKWSWVRIGSPYMQPAIAFRGGETGRARDLNGCHELSHIVREILGIRVGCCEERWCNRFAVATLAPEHVVRRAWACEGANLGRIQRHMPRLFATAATLRIGELGLAPVVVFDLGRRRYAEGGALPARESERLYRLALASNDGRAVGDGMRAYRLPDGADRVAIIGERMAA